MQDMEMKDMDMKADTDIIVEKPQEVRRKKVKRVPKEGATGEKKVGSIDGSVEQGERPRRKKTERPVRPDRLERLDKPEKTVRPDRLDGPEKTVRPDRLDRPEKAVRPDRLDRPEKVVRPEKLEEVEDLQNASEMEQPVEVVAEINILEPMISPSMESVERIEDEDEGNEIKEFFISFKSVFYKAMSNPIEAIKLDRDSEYEARFLIGVLYLLVMGICTAIHVPVFQKFMGVMNRIKFAGTLMGASLVVLILVSAFIYVFVLQEKGDAKYKDIIGACCIATAPMIIVCLIAFALGYVSSVLAALVLVIGLIYEILLTVQIATYFLNGNVHKANFVVIAITVVIYLIVYFSIKMWILELLSTAVEASVDAVKAGDGTVQGGVESLVEKFIQFLRDVDALLGNK